MVSCLAYFTELTKVKSAFNDEISTPSQVEKSGTTDQAHEAWTIKVERKDTPRDLLSLRTIAKKRSQVSLAKAPAQLTMSLIPNQPSLELSLELVKGESQAGDLMSEFVKTISKAAAHDPFLSGSVMVRRTSLSDSESISGSTGKMKTPPRRRPTGENDNAPPSAFRPTRSISSTPITLVPAVSPATATKEGWGSISSSFTHSFIQLIKLGSDMGESIGSIKMRGTDRSLSSLMGPLNVLANGTNVDNSLSNLDDRPHLHFTFSVPEKVKISCVVYYATALDNLRRRCAIEKSVIKSLARTEKWDASGGKSRASFFMTLDKRYIVKELVSKWNVSDT